MSLHPCGFRVGLLLAGLLVETGCQGMSQPATTLQTAHGEVRAILDESDAFPRFRVDRGSDGPDRFVPVRAAGLDGEADLLIARRGEESVALLVDEMAWHHVAQGELGGMPFVVAYCVVCDAGMGLTPLVDGRLLHLSAGGLSNGVVIARDDETGTYWNCFTGEGLAGPLAGRLLETWPIERSRAAAAIEAAPELPLARSSQIGVHGRIWSWMVTSVARGDDGHMPGFFRKTLPPADQRRPELELGLGVVIDGVARFYPATELDGLDADELDDALAGRQIAVGRSHDEATWDARTADGARPFQVWGRWYGFAATFPGCDVYSSSAPTLASR
jgi:hypothetical protein